MTCYWHTKEEAIEAWNTRTPDNEALLAQVEELKKTMLYEAAETRSEFNVPDEVTLLLETVANKTPVQHLDSLKSRIEEETIENCKGYILVHYQSYFIADGLNDMPRKYQTTELLEK
jgi:hypothetical protein